MRTKLGLGLAALAMIAIGRPVLAGRIEADPRRDYPLRKNSGPWMIMVTSFYAIDGTEESRRDTYQQAKDLALEIRRTLKIPAYTHYMRSNFGEDLPSMRRARPEQTSVRLDPNDVSEDLSLTEAGRRHIASLTDEYSSPVKRRVKEFDQVAVLAGDYATLDQARRVLDEKIKDWFPESMKEYVKRLNANHMGLRAPKKAKGPFWRAFVTPNPYTPKDYLYSQSPDPLLRQMNRSKFNLYRCPGRYSVNVATFSGRSRVEYHKHKLDEFINELEHTDQDRLQRAAIDAEELAKALRAKRWEAYVFHTRNQSQVTVGSFNDEKDPRIQQVIEIFRATQKGNPPEPHRKRLGRWQFDPTPLPIIVPRPS